MGREVRLGHDALTAAGLVRWLVGALMVCAVAEVAVAQPAPAVQPGSLVRIRQAVRGPRIEGRVERVLGDTLVLEAAPGRLPRVVFPVRNQTVHVLTGKRSALGRGAVIGGVAGLVATGAIGAVAGQECVGNQYLCLQTRDVAMTRAFLLTLGGTAAGAVIGALSPRQIWTRAGPAAPALDVGPRGAALGVSIRW